MKPEIFGAFVTLNCSACGEELPCTFSWDTVKTGVNPGEHLLDSIRLAFVDHLANDRCRVRNMRIPPGIEIKPGGL